MQEHTSHESWAIFFPSESFVRCKYQMKYLELHMHYCTSQLAHVTWELPDRPKSELMGRKPPAQLKTPTFFFLNSSLFLPLFFHILFFSFILPQLPQNTARTRDGASFKIKKKPPWDGAVYIIYGACCCRKPCARPCILILNGPD